MKINVAKKKITTNDIGKVALSVLYNSGYEWLQTQKENKEFIIEIKNRRNPKFHRMVFAIASYVVYHAPESSIWSRLTPYLFIKAVAREFGFVEIEYTLDGEPHLKAQSIAYESMEQKEFEELFDKIVLEASRITHIKIRDILLSYKDFM